MKTKLLLASILVLYIFNIYSQNGFSAYQMTPATYCNNTCLKIDALGNKWISTLNTGVYKFDNTNWITYDTSNSGIASNRVNDVAFEGSVAWFATQNGISRFDGNTWLNYNVENSGLPGDTVLCIYIDNSDIWVGTNKGLALFNGNVWTIHNTLNSGLINNSVVCINKDINGDIWVGTSMGLSVKSGNTWLNYNITNSNIPQDQINVIYIDNNAKWIGTLNSGLFKFSDGLFTPLESLFFNVPINPFPDIKTVRSISQGPQGGILINSFYEVLPEQIHRYETLTNLGFTFGFHAFDVSTNLVWAIKPYGFNTVYSFNYQNYVGTTLLEQFPDYAVLDVNEVRAGLFNRGDMFWDLYGTQNARYEVPKYSGKSANFASALWIGGIDSGGELHQAAQTYRQEGVDYFPGPLDTLSGTTDSAVSNSYDKIWKIDRLNIEEFQAMFANGSVQNGTYIVSNDIITWPAQGTDTYTRNMAPFVDANGDGLYNPLLDGDYPKISGDQMCYWIFNDSLDPHGFSHPHRSLQVEVHASAYAFKCSQINDSLKALNYTTFYSYEIYNRSSNNYSDTYVGIWNDGNIGSYADDFLGCNPSHNYGFQYNGVPIDGGENLGCYGSIPPMLGTVILNGPIAEPNDSIDNDNDGDIDEMGEKNLMTHFLSIDNGSSDSINGSPFIGLNGVYNYLSGRWKNGTQMTYGGNGITGNIPYNFMFDGIPGENDWNEVNLNNSPGDRGFVLGCGPFNLNAGQHINFSYALVYTRDTSSNYSHTTLFNENLKDVKKIQHWYTINSFPSCYDIQTDTWNERIKMDLIDVFPNPSNETITVKNNGASSLIIMEVYDITGKKVQSTIYKHSIQIIDISSLSKGMYLLKIHGNESTITKKIIKN